MKKAISVLFIILVIIIFFWQYFIRGLLPIPADTIIGLYHPFRDLYAKNYPSGIPFKNFLITDPVRQQYPWRELVISAERKFELPLWNPYNFAGTPLLANFQSASFYFFNILFFIMPFTAGWSLIIFLGPLLSGIFLFLYLDNLKLSKWASLLGAFTFSFSGFFISWLEWGTITHVGLWLPLILLAVDRIFLNLQPFNLKFSPRFGTPRASGDARRVDAGEAGKIQNYTWPIVFVFSLTSSFFAGHLQTFFYIFIASLVYLLARWLQYGKSIKMILLFTIYYLLFTIATAIQWIPTFQFISLSARNVDVLNFNNPGWFVPWQHLIQFIAPDFFGNPTTLNYWGVWNYAEFVGYVGMIPLIMAIFALFYRRDKKTLFFGTLLFLSLIFSLPTLLAKIPYFLKIPFLATAQPTRLLFVTDFTLAILSALGFDYLLKTKRKISIIYPLIFILIILVGLWIFIPKEHSLVVKSNLFLPTLLFIFSSILFFLLIVVLKKNKYTNAICIAIVVLTAFDLLRFGWKFTPFTQKSYLFPSTKALAFLQKNLGEFRIMSTDSRILPPNFSTIYRLKSIEGYDPLYLLRYGELIAASERKKADINPPFGFNRIITPKNYDSKIIDLLGVKYVLSLSELKSSKLKKVFQEQEMSIYENKAVLPRVFFVEQVLYEKDKEKIMNALFREDLGKVAVLQLPYQSSTKPQPAIGQLDAKRTLGKAKIIDYSENRIIVEVENPSSTGVLILTDTYYPTWRAKIDRGYKTPILQVDYNFRGISVPEGQHIIELYNSLF